MIGEVVTWDVEGAVVPYSAVLDALSSAGLDPALARPMGASNAFRRAVRKLSDGRIIRKVDESPEIVRFQFTAETKDDAASRLNYAMETIVSLHKEDGDVECDDPAILARARAAIDAEVGGRNGNDISRVVFRMFDDARKADLDLVPLRKGGGAYFVRAERADFVDRAEQFLAALHCRMNRFPLARAADNRGVREAVADKMAALVREFEGEVDDFGTDTRERTFERAAARVNLLRHKVESYAEYLEEEKGRLELAVSRADARLRAKLAEVARDRAREGRNA